MDGRTKSQLDDIRKTLGPLLRTDNRRYREARGRLNQIFWNYVISIGGLKNFVETESENGIDFSYIDFDKHDNYAFTCFDNIVFHHFVYFINSSFHETTTFRSTVFNAVVQFDDAIFYKKAEFDGAHFNGLTCFRNARFKGTCSFRKTEFHLHHSPDFSDAVFCKIVDFQDAACGEMKMDTARFKDLLLLSSTRKTTYRDIQGAINLYRIAKNRAQQVGDIEKASQYHYDYWKTVTKEKVQGKAWKTWRIWEPLFAVIGYFFFGTLIFGFGEKWHRQVVAAGVVILGCAGLFQYFNGIQGEVCSFGKCIYFSVVTFTTLGYGNLKPTVGMRWLVACEAVTGIVLVAMLVVSLARKFTR